MLGWTIDALRQTTDCENGGRKITRGQQVRRVKDEKLLRVYTLHLRNKTRAISSPNHPEDYNVIKISIEKLITDITMNRCALFFILKKNV